MDIVIAKLRKILEKLDAVKNSEEMEELNATLEDVILMLEDTDDDDRQEILDDAMDELNDIAGEYHDIPGMDEYADMIFEVIGLMESI